jgi:hypothetical protein
MLDINWITYIYRIYGDVEKELMLADSRSCGADGVRRRLAVIVTALAVSSVILDVFPLYQVEQ